MQKLKLKLLLASVCTSVILIGCGGGGGGGGGGFAVTPVVTPPPAPTPVVQNVASIFDFLMALFSRSGENSAEEDVNLLTLAVDDVGEPRAIP